MKKNFLISGMASCFMLNLLPLSMPSCTKTSAGVYGCQSDSVTLSTALYAPQKYNGVMTQTIDKYVVLCVNLERIVGAFEFNIVRQLMFSHPCIVRCYNDMVAQKSVQPLVQVWQAYKSGVVTIDKQKFIYELCHLIGIVFEQFLIKLAADLTGQSVQTLTALLDKLQIDLPLDDLIDILEQCYHQLSLIADQLMAHQKITWNKKTIMTICALVVVVGKVCQYYITHNSQPKISPIVA